MPARILELTDELVSALTGLAFPDTTFSRVYGPTREFKSAVGRFVELYPMAYADMGYADRTNNYQDNTLAVVVWKRWEEQGLPSNDWMDAEVSWVETNLVDYLGNDRDDDILSNWAFNLEVVSVYDFNKYKTNKVFFSELSLTFRQLT